MPLHGAMVMVTALVLLLGGCGGGTMNSVEVRPPAKGLLHYLQQAGQMTNVSDRGYTVTETAEEGQPESGKEASLLLQVRNPAGQPVDEFAEDMTKLMHLIVVSKDLSSFQHLHPTYEGEGRFRVKVTFPHGGPFLLVSEFMPDGKGLTVHKAWMNALGTEPDPTALVASGSEAVVSNGIEIKLSAMPEVGEFKAGEMAMLNFSLSKAGTGERIVLEPYLGTFGHCVILDENANQYVHVHAAAEMSTGSSVMFHTEFPKAGTYKLWAQFQYRGEVITAPYVVRVNK
ncbi:hypothetical protein [Paenibacillus sacheonensis]|uniref:Secreted protein n=1 Tax=Paenibacillus sacheonensis TaxID=742054 RepID=A0A7X4YU35_9BACL|nr:hypothetical protein [Paenibacillus sacheonensis]MBM7566897.1 hypothetical protein [Paenibacillus sacheonensis]NBC71519.1 hypothetical protein [Paenibacillus sacheonensis]